MGMVEYERYDVYLVCLDPTIGSEIKKSRPCIIISPNEMNNHINTVIIAPMTSSTTRRYPTRVDINFKGKNGQIVLDQIRTVDKQRLIRRLGAISNSTANKVAHTLIEMFKT